MPYPDAEWFKRMTATPWHTKPEHDQPAMTFTVDVGQANQFSEWLTEHEKTCKYAGVDSRGLPRNGCMGGQISFTFIDTTLGRITKVECACGGEADLTEYGNW